MNNKDLIFGTGVSSYKDLDNIVKVCGVAFENGIRKFDTAPSYHTEEILSEALRFITSDRCLFRNDYYIQTKIDPIQMYNGNVELYFENKLKAMKLDYIDALLIHWPLNKYFDKTWDELLNIKIRGKANRIGICNVRLRHLENLKKRGILPDIVQIERHPLNVFGDEVSFCKENDIEIQDYSPLCKMHDKIKESEILSVIAQKYKKDIGSIVLRWHIDTGTIPIFTSKNLNRIAVYSKIDEFSLNLDELDVISKLNCNHKLYLESLLCPGF